MKQEDAIMREKDIDVYGEIGDAKIVSFEDQVIGNTASMARKEENGTDFKFNSNGLLARTQTKYASINTRYYYNNRYKKDKDSIILVIDPRACNEHTRGQIYARQVQGLVIKRNKTTKELELVKTIMVNSDDFVENFVNRFDVETMKKLAPLLNDVGDLVSESEMPI